MLLSPIGLDKNMSMLARDIKNKMADKEKEAGVDKLPGEPLEKCNFDSEASEENHKKSVDSFFCICWLYNMENCICIDN